MIIKEKLLDWYKKNKRDLPWRRTSNPYYIWVSEIILQQTRVNQGLDYYNIFISIFPDIKKLANATIDEVMLVWKGLGYYTRARNMHAAAKHIKKTYNGKFPDSYDKIIQLKGVGKYTAAAVASIAFNESRPVIDGNVIRVYSRIFNITEPIDMAIGKRKIEEIAEVQIDTNEPGNYNQAIMEFGALQCVPKNPDCLNCIFLFECGAYKTGNVINLPVKSKSVKVKTRYFNYLIFYFNGKHYVFKRSARDIWNSLYQFPVIESEKKISFQELTLNTEWNYLMKGKVFRLLKSSEKIKHQLTHQTIYAVFHHIEIEAPLGHNNWLLKNISEMKNLGLPRLIDNYITSEKF